ncbi:hypothetical protein Dsin_019563 [Dipteronia sinensis]|uniref:SHSP domain-containing protein n=1 Tax=Dipteronia sinensis TaxID=43782 RepID=A0AAE0A7G4_9ROSI|nr:hypothetical protein Dsin_019563 [Dipteronia sinensis]
MNRRQEDREYEDLVPSTGWVREPEYDTLVVYLPGFKKEQLKVQVTTLRNLRVSGERVLGNNKWSRFSLEFPIPANYDTNEITAKFEGGSLYIKHPKIITAEDQKATTQKVPSKTNMEKPKSAEEEARMQKVPSKTGMEKHKSKEEKATAQEVPPTTGNEKQPMEKANGVVTYSADEEADAKSLEKKKSEDLGGEDENISGDLGQAATVCRMDKPGLEGLSQVGGGGLVTMMKQTRKLLNFVGALLFALAVGIYNCARNAIRLIGKSNN